MKSIGIIAEYNPFHNGHLYHLSKIKELYPDHTIVLVMSGNFTERGDVSIIDKWKKTEIAKKAGIDLIVELPFPFATQSADYFSYGAITLLEHLKVERVIFGSESNNIEDLSLIAETQLNNEDFDKLVKIYSKFGHNYPTALSLALKDLTGKVITTPNDLLGISYIKTIKKNNYKIIPETIKRTSDYHNVSLLEHSSATAIREALKGKQDVSAYVPEITHEYLTNLHFIEDYFPLLKYKILTEKDLSIYQTVEELSKFLLFGTTQDQQTYTVKEGDTIEDISFNNKLSPEEFLIANTEFSSAEDLLYPGKTVVLGVIQPQFDTVVETHVVSKRVKTRETIYVNDDTQYTGYEKVKQAGSDGLNLVTEKVQLVNGEIVSTVPVSSEVITSPVDKIIVRGTRKYVTPSAGSGYAVEVPVGIGSWVWPTNTPSVVTSEYGWRWGKLHAGMDISGTGYGSPIKAVNNGVVVVSSYTNINGHYIIIKHANGYFTEYAHMARRYVQKGAIVYANDVIGTMGQSGYAFGTHLHFGVWTGAPYTGTSLNPRSLYR